MQEIIILSPSLKKKFERIKKHAIAYMRDLPDQEGLSEDVRAFALMCSTYKIFHKMR